MTDKKSGLKIIFVASWPPKQCGIATFTQDLRKAVLKYSTESVGFIVAINDIRKRYEYDASVKCEIDQENLDSLDKAVRYINESGADVVSIQHEFGIWGGFDGEFVKYFIKKIKMPVVTTLHTVPLLKSAKRRENRVRLIKAMAKYSAKVTVMIEWAKEQLQNEYGIPQNKIEIVPHGAPFVEPAYSARAKEEFGFVGKKIISTFGLISPNKGINFVVEAMPKILKKHPDAVYLILGQPHPASPQAKIYHNKLKQLVNKLNLKKRVLFVDRYLKTEEVIKYLQATDIYITPYLVPEQVSSGTLTFAVVAGKCIVSTSYAHAKELLKKGWGTFVEMASSEAISKAINYLLDHPKEINKKGELAYKFGQNLVWPKIGGKYFKVLGDAVNKGKFNLPYNHRNQYE